MNRGSLFSKTLIVIILSIVSVFLLSSCAESSRSSGLAYEKREDGYWVVGIGTNAGGKVVVPATYEGEAVVGIAAGAFNPFTQLDLTGKRIHSIRFGENVQTIEDSAFYGNSWLETVELLGSGVSIGNEAFYGCSNLESVNVAGDVAVIGDSAFAYCEKLSSFDFKEGLQQIGTSAFYSCSTLTGLTLPESLVNIGMDAFSQCAAVKSLTFSSAITVIPEGAFRGLTGLNALIIPETVTEIGSGAFDELTNLKTLTIPKSVQKMDYCFNSDWAIEEVHYGGSFEDWLAIEMSNVASSPFYYSSSAKLYLNGVLLEGDIVIPEGITRIGNHAFENYRYITSVSFPHDMEYIGDYAFSGCLGLSGVSFAGDVAAFGNHTFSGCENITNIDLGNDLTKTGYYMFADGCTIQKLVIPSNVKQIDNGSFARCDVKELVISEGVERIHSEAFENINIAIHIPKSVKVIQFSAFATKHEISYSGTVADWASVEAHHLWNEHYAEFVVHCADGDVTIPHPYEQYGS